MSIDFRAIHPDTLNRMEEVRFYLIIQQLEQTNIDIMFQGMFLETICKSYGINISDINYAITYTKANRPKHFEFNLLSQIHKVNIRTICRFGKVSYKKMQSSLDNYINNLHAQPLVCCPDLPIRKAIVSFNKAYRNLFGHSSYLIKGIIYNESV